MIDLDDINKCLEKYSAQINSVHHGHVSIIFSKDRMEKLTHLGDEKVDRDLPPKPNAETSESIKQWFAKRYKNDCSNKNIIFTIRNWSIAYIDIIHREQGL